MKLERATFLACLMRGTLLGVVVWSLAACDDARKQECDRLLTAMKPLDQGTPASATVDAVIKQIDAMKVQDQALGMYAKNYTQTLTVLSATLKLKAGSSPPDGTDDVVRQKLKNVRTDRDDVQRLCSK